MVFWADLGLFVSGLEVHRGTCCTCVQKVPRGSLAWVARRRSVAIRKETQNEVEPPDGCACKRETQKENEKKEGKRCTPSGSQGEMQSFFFLPQAPLRPYRSPVTGRQKMTNKKRSPAVQEGRNGILRTWRPTRAKFHLVLNHQKGVSCSLYKTADEAVLCEGAWA